MLGKGVDIVHVLPRLSDYARHEHSIRAPATPLRYHTHMAEDRRSTLVHSIEVVKTKRLRVRATSITNGPGWPVKRCELPGGSRIHGCIRKPTWKPMLIPAVHCEYVDRAVSAHRSGQSASHFLW